MMIVAMVAVVMVTVTSGPRRGAADAYDRSGVRNCHCAEYQHNGDCKDGSSSSW